MPTSAEIRETLVAGGVDEGSVEAFLAVFGALRDEAVAEAVAKATEQNGHAAARLDEHADENDRQFRSMLDEVTAQIAEGRKELVDFRVEYERRFGDFRTENERQFAEQRKENEQQFAKLREDFAKLREDFAEQRGEIERRFAEQRGENERRFAEQQRENDRQFAELKVKLAEMQASFERRMTVVALGLGGLIVGGIAAAIAASAVFGGGA